MSIIMGLPCWKDPEALNVERQQPLLPFKRKRVETDVLVFRKLLPLFRSIHCIVSAKAHYTSNSQNPEPITASRNTPSTMRRFPASVVLSTGLKKGHTIAAAPGRLTDLWEGDLHDNRVAIKAFRIYSQEHLKEAEKVSRQPV